MGVGRDRDVVRWSRSPGRSALLVTLIVGATVLGGCRKVTEDLTSPRPAALGHQRGCLGRCEQAFHAAARAEVERHRRARAACRSHADSAERKACRKAEDRAHRERAADLARQRRACKGNCYDEGGGQGGR